MKLHFVTFLSPGTFVFEETTKSIAAWDVGLAMEAARGIVERYSATPFAFYFTSRERKDNELDSKVVATSPKYFLGGRVLTIQDIEARNDPKDRILLSNMRCNNIHRVVENTNSWKATVPLGDKDVVLDFIPDPVKSNLAR